MCSYVCKGHYSISNLLKGTPYHYILPEITTGFWHVAFDCILRFDDGKLIIQKKNNLFFSLIKKMSCIRHNVVKTLYTDSFSQINLYSPAQVTSFHFNLYGAYICKQFSFLAILSGKPGYQSVKLNTWSVWAHIHLPSTTSSLPPNQ